MRCIEKKLRHLKKQLRRLGKSKDIRRALKKSKEVSRLETCPNDFVNLFLRQLFIKSEHSPKIKEKNFQK